jgi:hypothetical protein
LWLNLNKKLKAAHNSTLSSGRDNIKNETKKEQPDPTHRDRSTGWTQQGAIFARSSKE